MNQGTIKDIFGQEQSIIDYYLTWKEPGEVDYKTKIERLAEAVLNLEKYKDIASCFFDKVIELAEPLKVTDNLLGKVIDELTRKACSKKQKDIIETITKVLKNGFQIYSEENEFEDYIKTQEWFEFNHKELFVEKVNKRCLIDIESKKIIKSGKFKVGDKVVAIFHENIKKFAIIKSIDGEKFKVNNGQTDLYIYPHNVIRKTTIEENKMIYETNHKIQALSEKKEKIENDIRKLKEKLVII